MLSNIFLDMVNTISKRRNIMFNQQVKDIMTKKVITANRHTTFNEVAKLMAKHDTGFIPIVDHDEIIGVITDRDIVIRGLSNRENYNCPVDKYMTHEVITIKPDASIDQASELMAQKQIKRLLVTDQGGLTGVISLADITNYNNKKALQALTGINKKNTKSYQDDNPSVDDFKL